jgi:hypothetical protein
MNFSDDLNAAAQLGWGPERIDEMARIGFNEGDLATFRALKPERRNLVLRLLHQPTEADFAALAALEGGKDLARWLLTLPAYRDSGNDEEAQDDQ